METPLNLSYKLENLQLIDYSRCSYLVVLLLKVIVKIILVSIRAFTQETLYKNKDFMIIEYENMAMNTLVIILIVIKVFILISKDKPMGEP